MRPDKDFEQGPPTQERDNHETYKQTMELSLGLRSNKGMDKGLRSVTFKD